MDIESLAVYFVENITQKTINHEARINKATIAMDSLIKKGWTVDTIKDKLDEFKRLHPSFCPNIYHVEEIMGNMTPPNNLLETDVFYYHKELRSIPMPSRIILNKETREYERQEEAFFLEMKTVYTLEDALNYWYRVTKHTPSNADLRRDKGKLEYLLKSYDIDDILFMIDLALESYVSRKAKLTNLFKVEDFADKARDTLMSKKSIHMIHGIHKIKKREQVGVI